MKIVQKIIKIRCKECHRKHKITCIKADYESWAHGEALIEDALHYLNDEERALLSNRTCLTCAGVLK